MQRLSLSFHAKRQKGDLLTHVTGDVNAVGYLFSDTLGGLASAVLLLVGMVVVCARARPAAHGGGLLRRPAAVRRHPPLPGAR